MFFTHTGWVKLVCGVCSGCGCGCVVCAVCVCVVGVCIGGHFKGRFQPKFSHATRNI